MVQRFCLHSRWTIHGCMFQDIPGQRIFFLIRRSWMTHGAMCILHHSILILLCRLCQSSARRRTCHHCRRILVNPGTFVFASPTVEAVQPLVPRPVPKARPSALIHCTSKPKSVHRLTPRDSLGSRPKPPPPLRSSSDSSGVPSGPPKVKPVPSLRGHYAVYPSAALRQLASEQGAMSKSPSPCIAQESQAVSVQQPTLHSARSSGMSNKRGLQASELPVESGPKKTVKHSSLHSGQWGKALTLWKELCILISCISSLLREILASPNSAALLEQLLRRVSDSTALRYISVLWGLFTTVRDLQLLLDSFSQVQLLDAIHVFQHSRSRSASVHSTNVLEALRWFSSTVKPDHFPSLHDGLFHSKSWRSATSKREAVPPWPLCIGLRFLSSWLAFHLRMHYSPARCSYASGVASDSGMHSIYIYRIFTLMMTASVVWPTEPRRSGSCHSAVWSVAFADALETVLGFPLVAYFCIAGYIVSGHVRLPRLHFHGHVC